MRFNLPAVSEARRKTLNELFGLPAEAGLDTLVNTLAQFVNDLGLPTRLQDLPVSLSGVNWEAIAEETTRMVLIHNNPRAVSVADCRDILTEMVQA
jgi:alcohol dehydrogenase class IV